MKTARTAANLRFILRDATLEDHQKTEDLMGGMSILDTPQTSLNWLSAMWRMHSHFAQCVDHVSTRFGLPPHQGVLLEAISTDIKTLSGHKPPAINPASQLSSFDKMIGIAYTIEGSALGASVLKKRKSHTNPEGSFYLDAMSQSSKARWPIFTGALETHVRDTDATIQGARSAFQYLQFAIKAGSDARVLPEKIS